MSLRFRPKVLLLAFATCCVCSRPTIAAEPTAHTPAAEAQRLYDSANDYVTRITEGDYSYSYLQFYWKRAQTNVDRVLRVYPETPTGKALASGQEKLGSFELPYFKERVLFRLEEKVQASVDSVNCAIFLCEIKGETWDEARRTAVQRIIEALSRQKRWGEALKFPVLSEDNARKTQTIFRVAARYEQADLVKDLLASAPKADLVTLHAIQGEAIALRGVDRKQVAALLDRDPADEVKLAVLSGMVQRESKIQLAAALRIPLKTIILLGDTVKRPEVRDDVNAVAKTFFPNGNPASDALLAQYRAALGERPTLNAPATVHQAYLEYLAASEKFDELTKYLLLKLPSEARSPSELKVIELLAQAGRMAESERYRAPYVAAGGIQAEQAALAQFRGRINSVDVPLTVHEKTLAELPFHDSAVLAQAMMEWSLTPNRSIRGPAPYDSVVFKFSPGFANLAAPKSKAAGEAASTQKQF